MTQPGEILAERYKLDRIIGRGGMADVWSAKDTRLGRDVAIKRLRVELASDPTFQARFRREAQSAANLNHPNIVSVYDTGAQLDPKTHIMVPFIVMELVEGVTLRDVLRDGRKILPERALELTAGVLDALDYAHRAGIVHRDIKPANVMLTPSGTVKVMDFGIARAVADTSATMTQTAAVIGTAQYLSPEQARGEKVDNRSDIYSAGCLLYELLTGKPPFTGDSPVSVAYQHVRENPIPPSQIDNEITPAMDAITLKALAKDPNYRYQDAKEMSADIRRALDDQPVVAAMASNIPRKDTTRVIANNSQYRPPARRAATNTLVTTENAANSRKENNNFKIVIISLAILLLAASAVAAFLIFGGKGSPNPEPSTSPTASVTPSPTPTPLVIESVVPDVKGLSADQATKALQDLGFKVTQDSKKDLKVLKGNVISTKPNAGTKLPEGSSVNITVSEGPQLISIPAGLEGKTFDEAKQILIDLGFSANNIKRQNATLEQEAKYLSYKTGMVIQVDPETTDPIRADKTITLTVATGKSEVPRLRGFTVDEAKDKASRAGFTIGTVTKKPSSEIEGTIIEQSPGAGRLELRGAQINVVIATSELPPTPSPTPSVKATS